MAEFMRNTDAFALGMEEDARLRSTVVTIVMLDRSPDWDVLVDRLERVARLMPMFRQRVVPTIPPHHRAGSTTPTSTSATTCGGSSPRIPARWRRCWRWHAGPR